MPAATTPSARQLVTETLAYAAATFPRLEVVTLDASSLEPRDARLALAIHRTVLQRWMTIEYLLDRVLKQPCHELEPALRAVLLGGGAQLLFFDRLPAHAVVDESVGLARKLVRPKAAGLVNAVLRRLAEQVANRVEESNWEFSLRRLPTEHGFLRLRDKCLPDPNDLAAHLSIITSHPEALVRHWFEAFGKKETIAICLHDVATPPVIVHGDPPDGVGQQHEADGFFIWDGTGGDLSAYLASHAGSRVQDPASALPVEITRELKVNTIVDYCAGRGTKTGQLAAMHPNATVYATDLDAHRFATLRQAFDSSANVRVVTPEAMRTMHADLVLLDVPCSNTGVLARRPEARYRYSRANVQSLMDKQQRIIEQARPLLAPGRHVLYSTCSLDSRENQEQVRWLAKRLNASLVVDKLTLPAGRDATYHDGGYYALLAMM